MKFTSGVVALFFLVAWLRARPGLRSLALVALALVVLTLVVSWRWLPGPEALQPLLQYASGSVYGNSLVDLLGTLLGSRDLAKVLTRTVFLAYLAWEVRQVWRAAAQGRQASLQAVLEASARALLAVLVLVLTWVLTWYFTWPLALAVFLGWRATLTRVVVAFSLTCLPFIYLKHYWGDAMPDALTLLYLTPVVLALRPPSSRARIAPSTAPEPRQTTPAAHFPGPGG